MRKAQLLHKRAIGIITPEEIVELEYLRNDLYQMTIEDILDGYQD